MATIILSTTLTAFADNQDHLNVPGKTLLAVLSRMIKLYPGLSGRLFGSDGYLNKKFHFYINDEDIAPDSWQNINVKSVDRIHILFDGANSR